MEKLTYTDGYAAATRNLIELWEATKEVAEGRTEAYETYDRAMHAFKLKMQTGITVDPEWVLNGF